MSCGWLILAIGHAWGFPESDTSCWLQILKENDNLSSQSASFLDSKTFSKQAKMNELLAKMKAEAKRDQTISNRDGNGMEPVAAEYIGDSTCVRNTPT